jgi:lipoprotein-anchoring transpeptidase ErfK/SrfK
MTALRQLSAIYLAAASTFVVAMTVEEHPLLKRDVAATAHFVGTTSVKVAVATNDYVIQPGWHFARTESVSLGHRIADALSPSKPPEHMAAAAPQNLPRPIPRPEIHVAANPPSHPQNVEPQVAMRQLPPVVMPALQPAPQPELRSAENETPAPQVAPPQQQVASAEAPKMTLAPQAPKTTPSSSASPDTAIPNLPAPSPAELIRVEERLKDSLTSEMVQNFQLFLYVSKAESGPWAQRMYVFQKQTSGDLVMLYNWPVSTGRDQIEFTPTGAKMPTFTPAGYYELDPKRFYPHYKSMQWGQPMPYAMFFNWVKDGDQTGLAIHAASGSDIGHLGQRASAGCIHLAPDSAQLLFNLIKTQYKGLAPRFAYDRRTGTMSNDGILLHDASGKVQLADGYKVLVFIENYGGENVVAALY